MSKLSKDNFANIKNINRNDSEYTIFQNDTKHDVLFCNFAYKHHKLETEQALQNIANELPDNNFQLLMMTDHIGDTKGHSYSCAVFIDPNAKEIIFANAGTRTTKDKKMFHDLIDDTMLIMRKKPFKMTQAAILNDMILDSLGNDAKNYKFHYTGHSLGAALSELSAADMDIKLTKKNLNSNNVSSTSFENPGTKPMINKMYLKAGLKNNISNLDFKQFNNRENMVNTLNEQVGKTYEIQPSSRGERKNSSLQNFAAYVCKNICKLDKSIVGRLIKKVFSLIAPGGVSAKLLTEHSLKNFNETIVKEHGIIREKGGDILTIDEVAISGFKSIAYEKEIYEELQKMKNTNNNIGDQKYIMNYVNPTNLQIESVTCSNLELEKAVKKVDLVKPLEKIKMSFTDKIKNTNTVKNIEANELKIPSAKNIIANSRMAGRFK